MIWDMAMFLPGDLCNTHFIRSSKGDLGRIDALPMIDSYQIFQRGGSGADWGIWTPNFFYELAFTWGGVQRALSPAPKVIPRWWDDTIPWYQGPAPVRMSSIALDAGTYVDEEGTYQVSLEKVTLPTGEPALHLTYDFIVGAFKEHEEAWFVERILVLPDGSYAPGVRRMLAQFNDGPITDGWNEAWVPR